MRLPDRSQDVVIVQGGLHHLPTLLSDLETTLREIHRVLTPQGHFVLVEPWDTPFLRLVHGCCGLPMARRGWKKLDALATMIDRERTTYESWLRRGKEIRALLTAYFAPERETRRWGKLSFVGLAVPR